VWVLLVFNGLGVVVVGAVVVTLVPMLGAAVAVGFGILLIAFNSLRAVTDSAIVVTIACIFDAAIDAGVGGFRDFTNRLAAGLNGCTATHFYAVLPCIAPRWHVCRQEQEPNNQTSKHHRLKNMRPITELSRRLRSASSRIASNLWT
jgi:hypothetical protein